MVEPTRDRIEAIVAISAIGKSPNSIRAFGKAREMGIRTIASLGGDGNILSGVAT